MMKVWRQSLHPESPGFSPREWVQRISQGNILLKGAGEVAEKPILAMATGLESIFFEYVLAHHDLKNVFSILITADQYTHSKPNPECYLKALKTMGLSATEVVGIEDSVSGVQALNAAEIFSIAVTNTNSAHELKEARIITEALTELIEK